MTSMEMLDQILPLLNELSTSTKPQPDVDKRDARLSHIGRLPREVLFNCSQESHLNEATELIHILCNTKDFDDFTKLARQAQHAVNDNLFVYVFFIALSRRDDCKSLIQELFRLRLTSTKINNQHITHYRKHLLRLPLVNTSTQLHKGIEIFFSTLHGLFKCPEIYTSMEQMMDEYGISSTKATAYSSQPSRGQTINNSHGNSDFNGSYPATEHRVSLKRSKRNSIIATSIEALMWSISLSDYLSSLFSPGATKSQVQELEQLVKTHMDATDSFVKIFNNKLTASLEDIQDIQENVAKNYWAINRNFDLLLGSKDILLQNQGLIFDIRHLILANQGLLLLNTGLLIGIGFFLLNIDSKLDRNYEAILRVESKVDRNYDAILRVENKVDRNLKVILSKFKILEYNLKSVIEERFKEVIDFVKQTRIEEVISELITFIRYFIKEKEHVKNLAHDQHISKLEDPNGILYRLESSVRPQSGNLHTLLCNIINQRFSIPVNSSDTIALTALVLLCSGTETYISVMSFLLEEYSYLAKFYYQENDLEKYHHYFTLVLTTLNTFKSTLAGDNGLINEVINILNEVKSFGFIKEERVDVSAFIVRKIRDLNAAKSRSITENNFSLDKPRDKIKYNFSISKIKTPIGNWEDKKKVSYAIQYQSNCTSYQVGEWSTATIYGKANPLLDIGIDSKGRTRIIFRKFDNHKPEIVGIVEDSWQKEFRDIGKDLYNSILEPNEEIAMKEIEVFLSEGADINAKYKSGRQSIHAAAESGNFNVVLSLISKGADINARDSDGYEPIHIAALVGHEYFINDLISHGANINARTNFGRTALHIAAEKGHVTTLKELMQIKGIDMNVRDQRGFTPLHTAASFGKNDIIILFSQDNRTDINAQSEAGFTPLHLATVGEYTDCVESLLAERTTDTNAKTKSGLTALHFSALIGNLDIVRLIVKDNRTLINEKSVDDWTPLHLAIHSKQEIVVSQLLAIDNIEINSKGKDDFTPLHIAASSGEINFVSKLIEHGALVDDVNRYGYMPLHFAVESGNLNVVTYLADKGANLHAECKDGYTPLGLAAFNGRMDIVQYFVNYKRVDIDVQNSNGMIPADFAASKGHFEIVEFLTDKNSDQGSILHWASYGGHLNIIRYLVDEKNFILNKTDKYGNTPLHNAAFQGHLDIIKYIIDEQETALNTDNETGYTPFLFSVLGSHLDVIKYFLQEKNVNLNIEKDHGKNTALHLAALNSNLAVVKYLTRKIGDINAVDIFGNTPLFLATSRGHLDMVKYLIQKGADFKVANDYGNTPLHFAAWNGHQEIVKHFVKIGVELNVTNQNGNNVLHAAAAGGNEEVIKFILDQGFNIHSRVIRSNESFNNGKTALHIAAENGRLDAVITLINAGADVSARDDSGKTSKYLATENDHTEIEEFLQKEELNQSLLGAIKQNNFSKVKEYTSQRASLEITDRNGYSLKEIALRNGNNEIIEFLEQSEQNLNIINAVESGNLDMVKVAVAKGASLEVKDKNDKNLWDLAAGNRDILTFLNEAEMNWDLMIAARKGELDKIKDMSQQTGLAIKDKNQNSLLHLAASSGNLDLIKYLIDENVDFRSVNVKNCTPLHVAASTGWLNVVKYLIEEKSVDFEIKDNDGNTSLGLASQNGHLDVVKYLVEKGADLNITNDRGNTPLHVSDSLDVMEYLITKGSNYSIMNKNGFTLFHEVADNGKLDMVKYLVEVKRVNIDIKNGNDHSALTLAAYNGYLGTVKYLIEKGAKSFNISTLPTSPLHQLDLGIGDYLDSARFVEERSIDTLDGTGYNSLHLAALFGLLGIVKYVVSKGAELDAVNKVGRTALHIAADRGLLEIVSFLIENGADLKETDIQDANPLHIAVRKDKLDVMKHLVEKGADIHARMLKNNDGKSALHIAIENSYLNSIEYLRNEKADFMTTDKNGYTPLHFAATLEVIQYIVEKRFDVSALDEYSTIAEAIAYEKPLNERDNKNNTFLHTCASHGYLGMVKYLIGKGLDMRVTNEDGNTALHLAAQKCHLEVLEFLIEKGADINVTDMTPVGKKPIHFASLGGCKSIVLLLLRKGISVDAVDKNWWTPLHYASLYGHLSVVKLLADTGADINSSDSNIAGNDGTRPIHVAAQGGHTSIIEFLLSKGGYLNGIDDKGLTPLHYAAKYGRLGVVKFLIDNGADLNAENEYNRKMTPLHVAAWEGKTVVIKYLIKKGADIHALAETFDLPTLSPLHCAAVSGDVSAIKYLIQKGGSDLLDSTCCECHKISVVFLSVTVPLSKSPLCLAIQSGHLEAAKYLIEKSSNADTRSEYKDDASGCTALMMAVWTNQTGVVKYLIENGADVNDGSCGDAKEPLHQAAYKSDIEVVKCLVEKGANLNTKNNNGVTPLYLAKHNTPDVQNYLRSKGARYRRSIQNDSPVVKNSQVTSDASRQFSWTSFPSTAFNAVADRLRSIFGNIPHPFMLASNANKFEPSGIISTQVADVNSTIFFLDVFMRKITGTKYVSTADHSTMSLSEAQCLAAEIMNGFEELLKEIALELGLSVKCLDFNPIDSQLCIVGQLRNAKFSEISETLFSTVKEMCPEFLQNKRFLNRLEIRIKEFIEKEEHSLNPKHISKRSNQACKPKKIYDKFSNFISNNTYAKFSKTDNQTIQDRQNPRQTIY